MRAGEARERVLDRCSLLERLAVERGGGRRLVFTNGCFDLLHAGHVSLLERAAALGEILVVGLNSDASVRRLKGPERPVVSEDERALLLAALRPVDYVVLFGEDTPLELIRALRPDVLVKGEDYGPEAVVGRELVEAYGGTVVRLPLVPGHSSTGRIERLRGRFDSPASF
jgi:D-beta-D-heptose 7-phosphate kinase/D-beta-D-heptose 1-phosphate adenosyltransferase